MKAARRFIAGATCPRCGTLDTVYIHKGEETVSRHCTRCDLDETMSADSRDEPVVSEWQPIRIKPD